MHPLSVKNVCSADFCFSVHVKWSINLYIITAGRNYPTRYNSNVFNSIYFFYCTGFGYIFHAYGFSLSMGCTCCIWWISHFVNNASYLALKDFQYPDGFLYGSPPTLFHPQEYKEILVIRIQQLQHIRHHPDHFTVLVRQVPLCTEHKAHGCCIDHFFSMHYPNSYLSYQILYNGKDIEKLLVRLNSFVIWL